MSLNRTVVSIIVFGRGTRDAGWIAAARFFPKRLTIVPGANVVPSTVVACKLAALSNEFAARSGAGAGWAEIFSTNPDGPDRGSPRNTGWSAPRTGKSVDHVRPIT